MSIEENKAIVRRHQEIYNRNNLEALKQIVAVELLMPNVIANMPPGLQGAKHVQQIALVGMPEWRTELEYLIAGGDRVAARITMNGTHTGDFWGIPSTGRRVQFSGEYNARIQGNKNIKQWGEEDGVSLMQQSRVLQD